MSVDIKSVSADLAESVGKVCARLLHSQSTVGVKRSLICDLSVGSEEYTDHTDCR